MQKLQDSPSSLSRIAAARLIWLKTARPEQLPPEGTWTHWLYLAGRGAGKTRTAAEETIYQCLKHDNQRWAVIAPTFPDARDICIEGESGLLNIARRYGVLAGWNRSMGELKLTNGSRIKLYSSEEPDRLRGPQHHGAWLDELAAFKKQETFDMMMFGLRLGDNPKVIHTTTPKPIKRIKELLARDDGSVVITRGSTFDNLHNLAPTFITELMARYENTRLGRQEMYGEVLDDVEGALWTRDLIERARVTAAPNLIRIVVAIDPAVTSTESSDETGIVVAGVSADGNFYVLADYTLKASPDSWARAAVNAYKEFEANLIVAETNNGGDMVLSLLRQVDAFVPTKKVTATRGKQMRAEPISSLYEQGRVHHVGFFDGLETQMCEWTPLSNESPDRLDALVWALTELADTGNAAASLAALAVFCKSCGLPAPKSAKMCPKCFSPLEV